MMQRLATCDVAFSRVWPLERAPSLRTLEGPRASSTAMTTSRHAGRALLRALRSPAASSSRATTTANVGAPRHPMKASDADPSRAAVAFRGITTKSPPEAELEQQRAVEEMERAQREMREEAARIASGRGATSVSSSSAPSQQPSPSSPPKPKPAPPVFGAPLGGSVARTPSTPTTEKPQPKRTQAPIRMPYAVNSADSGLRVCSAAHFARSGARVAPPTAQIG